MIIYQSVGKNCVNSPFDVKTIQSLLNWMPLSLCSIDEYLVVDGKCGPKTQAHITNYQSRNQLPADGKISPNGPTSASIQSFAGTLSGVKQWLGLPALPKKTPWTIDSTASTSLSVKNGTAAIGFVTLATDAADTLGKRTLTFAAAGLGTSFLPVGLEISLPSFPSANSALFSGPFTTDPNIPIRDLQGPCCIISGSIKLPQGSGSTIYIFNTISNFSAVQIALSSFLGGATGFPTLQFTAMLANAKAFGGTTGIVAGIPDFGMSIMFGAFKL